MKNLNLPRPVPTAVAVGIALVIWFVIPVPDKVSPDAWHLLALFIGTIEIVGLVAQETNLSGGFWTFLEGFNINRAGFIIVGIFVVTWVVALLVWRFGNIESKWELQTSQAHAPPIEVQQP